MAVNKKQQRKTRLIHAARVKRQAAEPRPVNPPVMRGSTMAFNSVADWRAAREKRKHEQTLSYGARGTTTTFALEDALTELEGGARTQLYPTGLAAIGNVLLALLKPTDHLLISDAVYTPTRHFVTNVLIPLGIDCEFYAANGCDLKERLRPTTRVIFSEVPGSLLYEMIDFAELIRLARSVNAVAVVDNTWASGWSFNPLAHGADISLLAVTKYIGGHSDLVLGAAVCNEAIFESVSTFSELLGQTCGPDDAALALRGLRTLDSRLQRHTENALEIAQWLQQQPEIQQVHCPMLPTDPGHNLWKQYFTGGNGLLTIEINNQSILHRDTFIDALNLFAIGSSWGGYESLALPAIPEETRSVSDWSKRGSFVRLHIGLESTVDLIADLKQALNAMPSI